MIDFWNANCASALRSLSRSSSGPSVSMSSEITDSDRPHKDFALEVSMSSCDRRVQATETEKFLPIAERAHTTAA